LRIAQEFGSVHLLSVGNRGLFLVKPISQFELLLQSATKQERIAPKRAVTVCPVELGSTLRSKGTPGGRWNIESSSSQSRLNLIWRHSEGFKKTPRSIGRRSLRSESIVVGATCHCKSVAKKMGRGPAETLDCERLS